MATRPPGRATSGALRALLAPGETARVKQVLADAPGPTNLDRTKYPMVLGPNGSKLHWTSYPDAGWEKLLRDVLPLHGPALLRMGLHCYSRKVDEDRLLIWRQVRAAPPGNLLRISLFDTTSLARIGRRSKRRPGDPVVYESGLLAEVELPGNWEDDLHAVSFPEPMRRVDELLLLVHVIRGWTPGLPKSALKARRGTVIYVARPAGSQVQVYPLDWARSVEGRFHWIARVARDLTTGRIVGDGAGVKPFLLNDRGEFLGWL